MTAAPGAPHHHTPPPVPNREPGMHDTVSAEPQGTAALLVSSDGQYLLHLRDANKPWICDPGTWSIPGGNREGEESCRDAVERELLEETGLSVPLAPFTVVDAHGPDGGAGRIQVYLGAWDGDADALPCPEGIMFRWFDAAKTRWLTMCPWTAEVIALHQRSAPVPTPRAEGGRPRPNTVGVHLFLQREDGTVLFGLRHPGCAFAPSTFQLLSGHCEQEAAVACAVREAQEEAGLVIDPADVELVHVLHMVDAPGTRPMVGFYFRARKWRGTPVVREPDRCVSWIWAPADNPPQPLVPYTAAALAGIRQGRLYTELGWS
ncbi:NUDIX domain-containing protein [Streptomyces sp. NPDC001389]|uniref:NUDIX hydrolase n=1 Tax=unclassified Streptomyces TaxID=2593676 RepID=UPI0036B04105